MQSTSQHAASLGTATVAVTGISDGADIVQKGRIKEVESIESDICEATPEQKDDSKSPSDDTDVHSQTHSEPNSHPHSVDLGDPSSSTSSSTSNGHEHEHEPLLSTAPALDALLSTAPALELEAEAR